MSHELNDQRCATRPEPDVIFTDIADYVISKVALSETAYDTARLCLMDSIACMFAAREFPACQQRLGPIVPGVTCVDGARVPGTAYILDPVQAAFNVGVLIRWLDFNDTWLAAEWGHPSDNLGGILAVADYLSRYRVARNEAPLVMRDVLTAMIKAYEIQGILALENSFNRVGLDHVILVRIATTAVVTRLLGGNRDQVISALSNAWLDGGALRTYRHAPNTGVRKSWAAGDATSRGVWHALMAMAGEMGYPSALSAFEWGFYDTLFNGKAFELARPLQSYVMENILFKIAYPAEFHAQTAVEAALQLHSQVVDRIDHVQCIMIETQEAGQRIIDKTGQLHNPADRDHCIQYMVAIALVFGRLQATDYEDDVAADPRVDTLRHKMLVRENKDFTDDYFDPDKRAIANAIQVTFMDGSKTDRIEVQYPLGHRRRRAEGLPLLRDKFKQYMTGLDNVRYETLLTMFDNQQILAEMPVHEFVAQLVVDESLTR